MNAIRTAILFTTLFAASAVAQTQLVRGKVEDVSGTNRFVLDGTTIPLTSTVLNLNTLVGGQFDLQVVNTGTATQPSLRVESAVPVAKIFDMGNLRFGRAERWQVNFTAGSQTAVFVQATAAATYLPFGASGTWLLGTNAAFVTAGTVTSLGQFEFRVTMPTLPELVGVSFSAQALVVAPNGPLVIANVDAKEVRAD